MKINTDPMNMDALDFDGDMWDPEYCDSELRAVEASGESRDELCLYRQTQLKLNRRLTGGNVTRVTIAWQWPSDAMDKKCCWDYPSIMLDFIQTSDLTRFNKIATQGAPQMAVDKEANSLSRVYSYYSKFYLRLLYV